MVKVVNINQGKNEALAQKCKTLAAYSVFIAKVRELEKECEDRTEAMKRAVIYCRDNDILKEFFEKNGTEVINMLLTEWNWDDAKKVWYDEGREDEREEIARNALAEGASIEFINKITGIDTETILTLQTR